MIESGCFVPGFMHACIQATPPRAFAHKRSQRIHTKFISGYRFLTGTHRDCIIIIPCGPSNRYVLRPSNSESISLIAKQGWQNSYGGGGFLIFFACDAMTIDINQGVCQDEMNWFEWLPTNSGNLDPLT